MTLAQYLLYKIPLLGLNRDDAGAAYVTEAITEPDAIIVLNIIELHERLRARTREMTGEIEAMFGLNGKIAMVTGGAVHLGFDAAEALAAAGADLAISSRDIGKAEKSAAVLSGKYGTEVLPLALDHTDPRSVAKAFARVMEWKGRLDILVNNAGGGSTKASGNFLENSTDNIAAMIDLNLTGVIYCC